MLTDKLYQPGPVDEADLRKEAGRTLNRPISSLCAGLDCAPSELS